MTQRLAFFVGLFLLLTSAAAQAQAPGRQPGAGRPAGARGPAAADAIAGQVRGRVVAAESGEPVVGASVAVWSRRDSVIVAGAVGGIDGGYQIQGLHPGTYYLYISSIGFRPHRSQDFTIGPGSPRMTAGTIALTPDPVAAEGIDVTIQRPPLVIEPDRNTYRAEAVAPAAISASEVLEAVPSVHVDTEGRISLRGSENVAIHINGRPAPLRGPQLDAYLRQLPAGTIDRIEVMPIPSARYDAEGMAGIINIVMKENVELGWSGGVLGGASTTERYNAGGNLGYQRGALTLMSSYGFTSDVRLNSGSIRRERFGPERVPISFSDQILAGESTSRGHNAAANLEVRLSPRDILHGSATFNRRSARRESVTAVFESDGAEVPTDRYDRVRNERVDTPLVDATLGIRRTWQPRRHELGAELRFNRSDQDNEAGMWRRPGDTDADVRTELELQTTDALTNEAVGQIDYMAPLAARTKLEAGYRGTARWLDQDFLVLKDAGGTWVRGDLSNRFDFDERVHAAYSVLSHGVGPVELQAGLRGEYVHRDFALADPAGTFPFYYRTLFPSGILAWRPTPDHEVKLSYARRVRRPRSNELNPFPVFFNDAQTVYLGNPRLDPEFTDSFELALSLSGQHGSIQLAPFYRRTTNVIRFIIDTADEIDGREVTSFTFQNLDRATSWGADLNTSLQLGSRFSGLVSLNVFKLLTEAGSESSLASESTAWSLRANGTVRLSPGLSLQAMHIHRGRTNVERGSVSGWKMTSLTLRQQFAGDRASLSLRVFDPFDLAGFRVSSQNANVSQISERTFNARSLQVMFQYGFGRTPRSRAERRERELEPEPQQPVLPE